MSSAFIPACTPFLLLLVLLFLLLFVLDVDECSASGSFCDVNADCENTRGSYRCLCKPGLTGDGKSCSGTYDDVFA